MTAVDKSDERVAVRMEGWLDLAPCPVCGVKLNLDFYMDKDGFDGSAGRRRKNWRVFVIKCWKCNLIMYSDVFDHTCKETVEGSRKDIVDEWNRIKQPYLLSLSKDELRMVIGALRVTNALNENIVSRNREYNLPTDKALVDEYERGAKLIEKLRLMEA